MNENVAYVHNTESGCKAKIKGVFSRSYCCYGNLLCHKINGNLFPNDWAVC